MEKIYKKKARHSGKFRALSVIIAVMLSCVMVAGVSAQTTTNDTPEVVILFTGELLGRLEGSDTLIGMDVVASIFEQQKADVPATFLLDCGDTIQGDFYCNNNEGEAAVEIMNSVGYDAMALGNHEFDYGYDRLLELAAAANFPFLTQPTVFSEGEPLNHNVIIERGGYKVGVFGLTTPASKQISKAFDTEFGNPVTLIEAAKKSAKSLRENGADIVICLSHIGNSDNFSHDYGSVMDISENVLGIDVIIDGHSDNAIVLNGLNTPVMLSDDGKTVGVIKFYKDGNTLRTETDTIVKEDAQSIEGNAKTSAVIAKWRDAADAKGKEVIGMSNVDITDFEKGIIRERESAIGNLVADAMRAVSGADIAFINSGNVRAPLAKGEITWADVNDILPYSNQLLTAQVSGSVIRSTLEHSAALRGTENAGGFLQVSGLSYTFDPSLPEYSRVTSITVDGMEFDDEGTYSLAVPNFAAEGGDGYSFLVDAFAESISSGDLTTVFAQYLAENGQNVTDQLQGRIIIAENSAETAQNGNSTLIVVIVVVVLCLAAVAALLIRKKQKQGK